MKKIILKCIVMLSTLMFSFKTYAEWTKVAENNKGVFYLDIDRIKKIDGKIYWWQLTDLKKSTKNGTKSSILFSEGDCTLLGYKVLSDTFYLLPMGKGESNGGSDIPDKNWRFPQPESPGEYIIKNLCNLYK